MDYADQLIRESRNNVNHKSSYIRTMLCPNRFTDNASSCPTGGNEVQMNVRENGIWTTIECPKCGYSEFWSVGDGNELF